MIRTSLALAALLALVACDNTNPFLEEEDSVETPGTDPEGVTAEGIPEQLANNLRTITYDPDNDSLQVDIFALDADGVDDSALENYTRNAALEALVPDLIAEGYQVYSTQDDALDRMFVAIVAESPDGSVQGAVVLDGGQFTRFFGGGYYTQVDGVAYTPGSAANDTGLVSYAGTYGGLTNLDATGDQLIAAPPGTDPAVLPDQTAMVTGSIFINADFDDNAVNGAIYDRAFVNLSPALEAILTDGSNLEDVFLIEGVIATDGTFFGDAVDPEQQSIGAFGGTFGGTEAAAVAGTINIENYIEDIENEEEFGVFVLVQCGQPGDAGLCDSIPVNP